MSGRAHPGPALDHEPRLRDVGEAHFRATRRVSERFFDARADDVSTACWAMAKRFDRGGRILAFASGPAISDAYHVSVEFVHPVLVGKRALPALVVEGDPGRRIPAVGRPEDIALGIQSAGPDPRVREGLAAAGRAGLLTVGLTGASGAETLEPRPDHLFVVPSDDPAVVQEVQETLYHVLWELVHVFFEHGGLL